MGAIRTWGFRLLIVICTGLLIYSWFSPWWTAYVVALDVNAVTIFPHAMLIDMDGNEHFIAGAEDVMPGWFFTFMWIYFGAVVLSLLASTFISGQRKISFGRVGISLPQFIIGVVGISYILVAIASVIVISINAVDFYNAPLQGTIFIQQGERAESDVVLGLQNGFWTACVVGPVLLFLAILRNKIVGEKG